MRNKRETAAEFMARLHADPDWARRHAEQEAAHKAKVEQIHKETEPEHAPLMAELAAAGVKVRMNPKIQLTLPPEERPGDTPVPVRSISDLVNTRDNYSDGIPILVRYLRKVQHPIMVSGIARALTVKEARGTEAPRIVLDRLRQTSPSPTQAGDEYQARWALANALTVLADRSLARELSELVADSGYGDVKERLEAALKNMGRG
jgi:hypothetical protein